MAFVTPTLSPPEKITREELADLSEIVWWKFMLALTFDIGLIAGCIYVSTIMWFSWPVYLLAVILIASRQQAFGVLMHECTHNRAFKSRKMNNIVGELLAWPVMFYLVAYRQNHLTHHKNLNTENDPDWMRKRDDAEFKHPLTRLQLLKIALIKVSGIGFIKLAVQVKGSLGKFEIPTKIKKLRKAFYLSILISSIAFGFWKGLLLYWVVPLMTFFTLFMYLRSIMEHHGNMEYDHNYTHSRNMKANILETLILMPHNVGYHLDHHLYPSVPFYNLPKLHRVLMKQEIYPNKAHITKGYVRGILTELV